MKTTQLQQGFTRALSEKPFSRREFIAALALGTAACSSKSTPPEFSEKLSPGEWRQSFDGRVVTQTDSQYEEWRQAMPWQMWTANRHPLLIARPNTRTAAVEVVKFARQHQLQVAIKSGGHNVSEAFLRDNGILLDLGELQGIEVDAASGTAWVEPALWSHLLIEETEKYNLAFPVAHCATVPMGGYLLGGGVGLNGDEWGSIACHSILAAEVILADGQILTVSQEQHPDIYWAVRGAGTGFFGVVTRFKLQLYPLPSHIYESMYFFPLPAIQEANQFLSEIAASGIAKTELMMLMAHNLMAPPDAPPEAQKVCVARIVTFADSQEEADQLNQQSSNHPLLVHAQFKQEMLPSSFQTMAAASVNASAGLGFGRYAVDTVWTNRNADSLGAISKLFTQSPSHGNHIVVSYKINPKLRDDSAFSMIGNTFIGAYAVWRDAKDDAAQFAWTAETGKALQEFSEGQYINEVNGFSDPAAIERCYSPEAWTRLRKLRKKYDPESLIHDYHGLS
jgi:FAD/FMN-containing dehydrogenase|tara:strand:- start:60 stop:1583 length:1524 start_codon:yes stop_codon:yes gene_type:complete